MKKQISTLVSRQLSDSKTPGYALQLAAKELGLDEKNAKLADAITERHLSAESRERLIRAIKRAAKLAYGVRADRVVFDPKLKTGLFPFACGTLLDKNGTPVYEGSKRKAEKAPKAKAEVKTLDSKFTTKSKVKAPKEAHTCKCEYCGRTTTEMTYKINKGACHKPKCVLQSMREHL